MKKHCFFRKKKIRYIYNKKSKTKSKNQQFLGDETPMKL